MVRTSTQVLVHTKPFSMACRVTLAVLRKPAFLLMLSAMKSHCFDGDAQAKRYLLSRPAFRDELQDFPLARVSASLGSSRYSFESLRMFLS